MKNIYIIGSLSQSDEIKTIADKLSKISNVEYVKPESKRFEECVSDCFDNIEWADDIYVLEKEDGTYGKGVTYELEYAKRLCKPIVSMKWKK